MSGQFDPSKSITDMIDRLTSKRDFPIEEEIIREWLSHDDPNFRQMGRTLVRLRNHYESVIKAIDNLVDMLEFLRVCIKYQGFDLVATRRERDELKRMLGEDDR